MLAYGSGELGDGRGGRSAAELQTMNALLSGIDPVWNRSTVSGAAAKLSARYRWRPPLEVTTSAFPSGDQRGVLLSTPTGVRRAGAPPPTGTIHTPDTRLFSLSRTVVTVNAIHLPSGDIAG